MIKFIMAALLSTSGWSLLAEETPSETATRKTHEAERSARSMGHKAEEAVCAQGDVKCAEEKAKHRAQESSDYMRDKADEMKQKADDSSKE